MAKVADPQVEKALTDETLRDISILELILRARKIGFTRKEIRDMLLRSEEEVSTYLEGGGAAHRFGAARETGGGNGERQK